MTRVCRPTPLVRFMPMSEHCSKQLMHCMARCVHAVVFLPMIFCHGTRRNTIQLATCKRTISTFFLSQTTVEMVLRGPAVRLTSLGLKPRALRRDLVKPTELQGADGLL
jgi:hypothetical protein